MLQHISRAVASIKSAERIFPEHISLPDSKKQLVQLFENFVKQREQLLLENARKKTSLCYQWSWWAYPINKNEESSFPREIASSPIWYEFEIDAVTVACKDPCLVRMKDSFYVLVLNSFPQSSGKECFLIRHCMTPWKGDGQLPIIGMGTEDCRFSDQSNTLDEIYLAYQKSLNCDEWDGPSRKKFFLLSNDVK